MALGLPALVQDCQVLSLDYSGAMEAPQEVRVRLEVPAFQGRLLAVKRDLLVLDYLGQKCLFLAPLVAMPDQEQEDAPLRSFRGHLQNRHLAAGVEVWGRAQLGRDFLLLHPSAVAVGPVQVRLPLVAPLRHLAVPVAA